MRGRGRSLRAECSHDADKCTPLDRRRRRRDENARPAVPSETGADGSGDWGGHEDPSVNESGNGSGNRASLRARSRRDRPPQSHSEAERRH